MTEEKKRSSNFTQREKEILISLVEKHINVLECKKTNAIYNKQKQECWRQLALEYNALQTSGQRTGYQLRILYEQMKKIAKQHKADSKVEILKTGGGNNTNNDILSSQDEKILNLLQENFFYVDNVLDSNMQNISQLENTSLETPSTSRCYQSFDKSLNTPLSLKTNIGQLTDSDVLGDLDGFTEGFTYNETLNETSDETIQIVFEEEPSEEQSQSLLQFQPRKKLKRNEENVTNNFTKKITERSVKKNNNSAATILKPLNLSAKKKEVYENKVQVLHLVQKNEEEKLKGIQMDTEIKEIVKEKEVLDLKIKKIQYERLLLEQ